MKIRGVFFSSSAGKSREAAISMQFSQLLDTFQLAYESCFQLTISLLNDKASIYDGH